MTFFAEMSTGGSQLRGSFETDLRDKMEKEPEQREVTAFGKINHAQA